MKKKECVAMILAGGQGSRLGTLTKNVAKPAVPFGSKYKIIDFPLSNCSHSGIDTVGVLTQYEPLELNTYIGNGQPWGLDRKDGGVFVLPPYLSSEKGDWYKGTANAIYQNMGFISQFSPSYVVVLSGDHIYKMDYRKMLSFHKKNNADATIAVIEVPWNEASRFGIMNTDENMKITEFKEKPKNPESNLASMGVYIFNWETLKKYLIADENNSASSHDFGKNIIPEMLKGNQRLFAYSFSGYWQDVGTVESLWRANMELLGKNPPLILRDSEWKIYSRTPAKPPHFISESATVKNSFITEGCEIYGTVINSVISEGVVIGEGAYVENSVVLPCSIIEKGAKIYKSVIGTNSFISENAVIGSDASNAICDFFNNKICTDNLSLIAPDAVIDKNIEIAKGSMVTRNVMNKTDWPEKGASSDTETA